MKNHILLIIILLSYNLSNAQIVDIPDANFKFALVNLPVVDTNNNGFGDSDVDTNDDGEIQVTEAEATQNLRVSNFGIVSLEGIQSFINLLEFNFSSDPIENVDLSQNLLLEKLGFGDVPMVSIDLSQNINLIQFGIGTTEFTEIDVSQNLQLERFSAGLNPLLSNINISQNVNLKTLHLIYNDLLSEIDISDNINLEEVLLYNNSLTSLDVSNNPNIVWLDCAYNQLATIDLSENINLEGLDFKNNQLTSLDLSQNPNIFRINCENNQLTSLDLKNGNTNSIVRLIAYGNPGLTCIQVDDITYANNQICDGSNDGNWCKDEIAIYSEDCNLGITEQSLQEAVQLYPNPVKNTLHISIQNELSISSIKIYDTLGRLVLQKAQPTNFLDVSRLASGFLLVEIETNKGLLVKKIIKE